MNPLSWSYRNETPIQTEFSVNEYATDGNIPATPQIAVIRKATAATMTMDKPVRDGMNMVIASSTAAAHQVTCTTGIDDGVTGGPKSTLTFPAFAGASISLVAIGNRWTVTFRNNVTVS